MRVFCEIYTQINEYEYMFGEKLSETIHMHAIFFIYFLLL